MQAHILLVDDEEGPREALKFALERKNRFWRITTANGVDEARRILEAGPEDEGPLKENGPVDVVLTDMLMGRDHPEGGLEVLEIAKRRDPFVMVILFTAHDKKFDRDAAYEAGAFDFIEKNILGKVASQEISTKTKAALHWRRMIQRRFAAEERSSRLRRYFDPRIQGLVLERPSFLDLKKRPASVLNWHLHGLAGLYASLHSSPDLLRQLVGDYYRTATAVVFRHNGILAQLDGARVTAIFCGFGPAGGDFERRAAADAARGALEMRHYFGELLKHWRERLESGGVDIALLGLGAGLDSGVSLVGEVGTDLRDCFTALGPHVDFAARLVQRAAPGQILLSGNTGDKLPEEAITTPLGVVRNVEYLPGEQRIYSLEGWGSSTRVLTPAPTPANA